MKTVYSDISQIAHLWANQVQNEAKNPIRNFYFYNNVIYSYGGHFPIAKHVEFNGKKVILFTTRGYSTSTAKHIQVVRGACSHKKKIYCKNIDWYGGTVFHDENMKDWISRIEYIAKSLVKAKKPEIYLNKIQEVVNEVKAYLEFFELETPLLLQQAISIKDKEVYQNYLITKEEIIKLDKEKQYVKNLLEFNTKLEKWLSGESDSLYGRVTDRDYLRVNGGIIQTSQNVKLSFKEGEILYNKVKDNMLKVGDRVLQFTVDEIGDEYKIGCHTFPREYLLEFGAQTFN